MYPFCHAPAVTCPSEVNCVKVRAVVFSVMGASGLAAVEPFARQPADGYTMFFHGAVTGARIS